MDLATIVVSALYAAMLAYSAVRKLGHRPEVVQSYRRAGVPEAWLGRLAALLLTAAAALVAGLFWTPLGVATAAGLACYFAVAVTFHLRARDQAHVGTPVLMLALAGATLALHVAS